MVMHSETYGTAASNRKKELLKRTFKVFAKAIVKFLFISIELQ
jgi:hypothetical protein